MLRKKDIPRHVCFVLLPLLVVGIPLVTRSVEALNPSKTSATASLFDLFSLLLQLDAVETFQSDHTLYSTSHHCAVRTR